MNIFIQYLSSLAKKASSRKILALIPPVEDSQSSVADECLTSAQTMETNSLLLKEISKLKEENETLKKQIVELKKLSRPASDGLSVENRKLKVEIEGLQGKLMDLNNIADNLHQSIIYTYILPEYYILKVPIHVVREFYAYIHIHTYIHTYIYIYICIYI